MPTSITLQVDNPSILRSLKRILAAIEGVSIVNQKGSKSKTTVKMTEREFYAKIDHSIESAKDKECSTMLPQETGAEFIDRLLSK